ncbi:hypothetical protein WDU94_009495 [Cyamophila willieti]
MFPTKCLSPSRFKSVTRTLTPIILIWLCQWKLGVSELSSNLQSNSPSSNDDQIKESVIIGIPVPVEKSAVNFNNAVSLNNVFFLVRNPSQFPSAIEKLVTRIQNYFSNFNSLQSLTDRPRPTLNATDTNDSSTALLSSDNVLASSITGSNASSPSLRFNHIQDVQNIDRVDQEPDPVYTITVGPNIVYEPPQSYYPAPVSNSYLPPVEDSHLNEVYYRGSPQSYHAPASSYSVPSSTLLPPIDSLPNQAQHASGGYYYPSPCSTTTSNPSFGPCVPEINQPSTTEATYLPPYEPESEVQGPFMISPPKTPPTNSFLIQEPNIYPTQPSPCSQSSSTTPQSTPYGCNPPTTTPEPITKTVAPCYTTTEKPSTTTVAPCSTTTTTEAPTTTPTPPCHTTTIAPTTTTTTTTTEKPTTSTTTTKAPCHTTTTAKPTTKPPCHTTTEKPTTTTTKQPCQHSTTTTSTTPPCQHTKPSVTEPTWTYLPPQKPTNSPSYHTAPATSRKPLYYLPPQDNTYQAANQINNNYYRPLFRSQPKFLYRLKRLFGLV